MLLLNSWCFCCASKIKVFMVFSRKMLKRLNVPTDIKSSSQYLQRQYLKICHWMDLIFFSFSKWVLFPPSFFTAPIWCPVSSTSPILQLPPFLRSPPPSPHGSCLKHDTMLKCTYSCLKQFEPLKIILGVGQLLHRVTISFGQQWLSQWWHIAYCLLCKNICGALVAKDSWYA